MFNFSGIPEKLNIQQRPRGIRGYADVTGFVLQFSGFEPNVEQTETANSRRTPPCPLVSLWSGALLLSRFALNREEHAELSRHRRAPRVIRLHSDRRSLGPEKADGQTRSRERHDVEDEGQIVAAHHIEDPSGQHRACRGSQSR